MLAFSMWNALTVAFVTFLFIVVLMMLFAVIIDLVRDPDLGGGAKALWMVAFVVLPLFGLLAYVVVRGRGMNARSGHSEG